MRWNQQNGPRGRGHFTASRPPRSSPPSESCWRRCLNWLSFDYFEADRIHHEYEEPAARHVTAIDRAINHYIDVVHSISALYAASAHVSRDQFTAFVERSMRVNPGFQALEWIPRVTASQRAAYEAQARDDGFGDFRISERSAGGELVAAAVRDEYYPVYYVEPYQGNERALGFDLASNPARREALERARDTGQPVATQRITLVQETGGQFGFLVFVPAYKGGAVPATVSGRRDNLRGFSLGVFRIGDIVDSTMNASETSREYAIFIFDANAAPGGRLLYAQGGSSAGAWLESANAAEILAGEVYSSTLDVAGREWTILFMPNAGVRFRMFHAESAGIAAAVLALTILFLLYLGRSQRRTDEIERLVAQRSRELTEINAALEKEMNERKSIQQQLTQTQKMEAIGQLTGGIAHDFNNLLMIVDGYTRRAVAKLDDRKAVEASMLQVLNATDKATKLTKQLLSFSRRKFMETRVVRVTDVMGEIEGLIMNLMGEQTEVEYELACDDIRVKTDPGELSQAVVNLAINARDAMPNGGRVVIGTRLADLDEAFTEGRANIEPGRFVEVYVEDNGTGIDEDTLPHVFEPFFTTKEQGSGTGLGLAMVYGFAQQSGGAAEVSSVPGEGATVSIYLPVCDRDPEIVHASVGVQDRGRGETILVVEDDRALLDLTSSIVEDLGYTVLTASNGMEALEVDEDHDGPIDMLPSDVLMPAMGGFELAEIMCERRRDMKVLFMSGYARPGDANRGKLTHRARLLQKPVKENVLAQNIRRELDSRELRLDG